MPWGRHPIWRPVLTRRLRVPPVRCGFWISKEQSHTQQRQQKQQGIHPRHRPQDAQARGVVVPAGHPDVHDGSMRTMYGQAERVRCTRSRHFPRALQSRA